MNSVNAFALRDGIDGSISREELANLPIRRYEGRVCLVMGTRDLAAALEDLRQERVIGLDTETRPAFRKGEHHLPCLVQAATAHAVYLFQFCGPNVFPALAEMFSAPRSVKAGVGLAHDLRQLKLVFPFQETNLVDLGVVARGCGLDQSGVRNLAGMFLRFRIPKGNSTSNWAARRLSPAQITYAATDAWACRELFLRFESLGLLPP
ncbi:MAG: 3'-5' exonuclease [Betaproteobacteria bacterium]